VSALDEYGRGAHRPERANRTVDTARQNSQRRGKHFF